MTEAGLACTPSSRAMSSATVLRRGGATQVAPVQGCEAWAAAARTCWGVGPSGGAGGGGQGVVCAWLGSSGE